MLLLNRIIKIEWQSHVKYANTKVQNKKPTTPTMIFDFMIIVVEIDNIHKLVSESRQV